MAEEEEEEEEECPFSCRCGVEPCNFCSLSLAKFVCR